MAGDRESPHCGCSRMVVGDSEKMHLLPNMRILFPGFLVVACAIPDTEYLVLKWRLFEEALLSASE